MARDLDWAAIYDVADRLNRKTSESTLEVRATRRRSLLRWSVIEGIEAIDKWTDEFEPVRRRRLFGATWSELQPVQRAAANIGRFLADRPDFA